MSAFSQRGLSRNSVRKGLDLALQRGYIVKTAEETSRTPARYALRWEDSEGQAEAVRRERLAGEERGSKNDPVKFCATRGSKNDPPFKQGSLKEKNKEIERTFNVREEPTFVSTPDPITAPGPETRAEPSPKKLRSKRTQMLDKLVEAVVAELQDLGSERRHHQLLDICQQRNLDELPRQALAATRRRLASESTLGPLEKPGAYYQRILLALLEDHQVFVPKSYEDDPVEVSRSARISMGLAPE